MRTYDKVLRDAATQVRADVRLVSAGGRPRRFVPTGFEKIDAAYGGLRVGVVTELLGHTGDGKSAFARQVTEGAARAGHGVLAQFAEDPEDATAERQLAGDTGIGSDRIGRLDLTTAELDRLDAAATAAAPWARRVLPVFDTGDVESVFALIDATTTVGGADLGLVVLDYAQLFGSGDSLESELAELAKGLHARGRRRKFAVLLTSQVDNRVIPRGRDRWWSAKDISGVVPGVGDSEWSRRMEKAAKSLWSVVRPGRWRREFGDESAPDDVAELHVKKQNFGPTGWVELAWDGPGARFS